MSKAAVGSKTQRYTPGPSFTVILKVENYLNFKVEKITLRKIIFQSYSESQFLRNPDE